MFATETEKKLTKEYLEKGYIIRTIDDVEALDWIRNQFACLIIEALPEVEGVETKDLLNDIHKYVPVSDLNNFRLKIIQKINSINGFREMYFRVARNYLDILVGNELAMQLRINLSIQLPQDDSSLLPVHSDIWSGDSPYEVVVWLPLVDCYRSKAMYILPPENYIELDQQFKDKAGSSSENLYQAIKKQVQWLDVRYGELLIFDQALPHGNRLNKEEETRWSMNCRFKGVFTPYGDKKIGEFFEPITLRAASQKGMAYRLPDIL
mgnify:CR=1 FL=1|jgi:sporadic carbohydrate cluster 2OG-Fe(II) oxygenase